MLEIRISNATGEELYRLEIHNVTPLAQTETGTKRYRYRGKFLSPNIAAYSATLWGPSLPQPLKVELRKFNRELGAIKLLDRVLARLFHQHMDQLVDLKPKNE